jgi:tRNA threonylcarbamoyladenosine biosynthesis protein TsaB
MLLALDTSTRVIGLALYDGFQVVSESIWTSQDHHTVELAPAVAEMLRRSGVEVGAVGAVAVATGPGSFTGLRIGLALAKGLALARKLPLIGVPSLDVLAYAQPPQPYPLAAVLRAGRGRLAVGWYRPEGAGWESDQRVEVLTAIELSQQINAPTWVCGELDEADARILNRKRGQARLAPPSLSVRRPAVLAEIGWKRWQEGLVDDPASLAPIYLHYNDPVPGGIV